MQNKLSIRNFRVFNDEGSSFEFKPITLLTGANGAGKSSLAKAVMLMQGFFSQGIQDLLDNQISFFEPSKGTPSTRSTSNPIKKGTTQFTAPGTVSSFCLLP